MGYYVHATPGVGEIYTARNGGQFEILAYEHSRSVLVRFLDTGYENRVAAASIRSRAVADPRHPRMYGNYIGVGPYNEGNSPIVNQRWSGMHKRAGRSGGIISVDQEWLNYQK